MLSLRALTVATAAALTSIAASPVTIALAAGNTSTVKDPYGENKPLGLASASSSHTSAPGSTGGSLVRTVLGLAVVIAVIYGLTWVLRQMKASKEDRGFGALKAEASVPLGPGRAVHLIRVGTELVLVGSAEQGVVPIRTYSEDEALALGVLTQPEDDDDAGRPARSAFIRDAAPRINASKIVAAQALSPVVGRLREWTLR